MKTIKINHLIAIMLVMALLAPLNALGGSKDDVAYGPINDQPWGGEIDNADYKTGSIASIGNDVYPSKFDIISIRNIGTPLVLIDYLQMVFSDYTTIPGSSSIRQENISAIPVSTSYAPLSIKNTRYSIRKGR